MEIAKIADTNLSQELNNFFTTFEFQNWKAIVNFIISYDELDKTAEMCSLEKPFRNLPINVKIQECKNIDIEDIVELNFINLFEETENKIDAYISGKISDFPSISEMWRHMNLEYSKIEHANYNERYCFETKAIVYKRLFFIIAANEQFNKLFKIQERINKKLEDNVNYQKFLTKAV